MIVRSKNSLKEFNDKRKKLMAELLEETKTNTEYIKSKGYRLTAGSSQDYEAQADIERGAK